MLPFLLVWLMFLAVQLWRSTSIEANKIYHIQWCFIPYSMMDWLVVWFTFFAIPGMTQQDVSNGSANSQMCFCPNTNITRSGFPLRRGLPQRVVAAVRGRWGPASSPDVRLPQRSGHCRPPGGSQQRSGLGSMMTSKCCWRSKFWLWMVKHMAEVDEMLRKSRKVTPGRFVALA